MENKSDVGNQCLLDGNVGQPFHPSYPNVARARSLGFLYSKEWGTTNVGDSGSVPLIKNVNNYRLPFYHRLDLGIVRHTKRGYWTISIYNAYCHKNIISIRPGINNAGKPVFQKLSILPIIPSFSYTWLF